MIDRNVFKTLIDYLDKCSELYVNQYQKNFDKWQNIGPIAKYYYDQIKDNDKLDQTVASSSWGAVGSVAVVEEATYGCENQAAAKDYLKKWITKRFQVLNNIWNNT